MEQPRKSPTTESKVGTPIPNQHSFCDRRSRFWVDTQQYLALNHQNRRQNSGNANNVRQP